VQPPVGEPVAIEPLKAERAPTGPPTGGKQLQGASTTWAWISETALALDAESTGTDPAGWAGTWTVTFIDVDGLHADAVVKARIFLFGDVAPSLAPTTFRAGEDNEFKVTVVRPDESADGASGALAGLDGTISIDGEVTDPATAASTAISKLERVGDEWVGTYRAPQDLESPSVNLTLRLGLVTASGIALPPSAATFPVTARSCLIPQAVRAFLRARATGAASRS
jgi:hypothetical protein